MKLLLLDSIDVLWEIVFDGNVYCFWFDIISWGLIYETNHFLLMLFHLFYLYTEND